MKQTSTLREKIESLIKAASMCWNKVPEGTFREDQAELLANAFESWIYEYFVEMNKLYTISPLPSPIPYDAMGTYEPDPLPEFKPDYVKCSKCHNQNFVDTNLTKFTCYMCNKINGLPKMTRIK